VKTGTVGNTLNYNLNTINMNTILIIITGVIAISAIAMVLASYNIVKDENGNKIPDWVEDKFSDIKEEIKKIKKISNEIYQQTYQLEGGESFSDSGEKRDREHTTRSGCAKHEKTCQKCIRAAQRMGKRADSC
jgi:uncharacterized protein YxeA